MALNSIFDRIRDAVTGEPPDTLDEQSVPPTEEPPADFVDDVGTVRYSHQDSSTAKRAVAPEEPFAEPADAREVPLPAGEDVPAAGRQRATARMSQDPGGESADKPCCD